MYLSGSCALKAIHEAIDQSSQNNCSTGSVMLLSLSLSRCRRRRRRRRRRRDALITNG